MGCLTGVRVVSFKSSEMNIDANSILIVALFTSLKYSKNYAA
jgi:hypothetical protein